MKLYVMRDRKAEQIVGQVVSQRRDEAAIRLFTDLVEDTQSIVGKHPSDFELLHVADIDEESGTVSTEGVFGYPLPRFVIDGTSVRALLDKAVNNG